MFKSEFMFATTINTHPMCKLGNWQRTSWVQSVMLPMYAVMQEALLVWNLR